MMNHDHSCLTEDDVSATSSARKTQYWTDKEAEKITPTPQPKFRVFDPNEMSANNKNTDGKVDAETPVMIAGTVTPKTPWTFPRRSDGNNGVDNPSASKTNVAKSSRVSRYFQKTPTSYLKSNNNRAPDPPASTPPPGEQLQQQNMTQQDQDEPVIVTPRTMTFRKIQLTAQKRATYLKHQEQFHMQNQGGKSRNHASSSQELMSATGNEILLLPSSLLPYWCLLTIGAAMCLTAIAASTPETHHSVLEQLTQGAHDFQSMQMGMAIATLSMVLSFFASLLYLVAPSKFVGTLYEVTMVGLNVVLWCAGLPIAMNPYNQLAVRGASMNIVNGNLFILTWACFFLSWILLKWVLDQIQLMDIVPSSSNPMPSQSFVRLTRTLAILLGLLLSSMVAMVASARSFQIRSCASPQEQTETDDMVVAFAFNPYRIMCQRITFSLVVSVMSFAAIFLTLILRSCKHSNRNADGSVASRWWHFSHRSRAGLAGLLALFWLLVLICTTFGLHAPAYGISNYFLSLWASFLLSLCLFKQTAKGLLVQRQQNLQQSSTVSEVVEDEEMPTEREAEMNSVSETPPPKQKEEHSQGTPTQQDSNTSNEPVDEQTETKKENDDGSYFGDYCSSVDDDASLRGLDLEDSASPLSRRSGASRVKSATKSPATATTEEHMEEFSPVQFNNSFEGSATKQTATHAWGLRHIAESDNEKTMIFEDPDTDMSMLSAATTRTTNSTFRTNVVTPGRPEFSAFVNGDDGVANEHEFSVCDPFSPSVIDDDCPLNTPPPEGYHTTTTASSMPMVVPFSVEKQGEAVQGESLPFDFS